jgi:hypothetical protein
MLSQDDMEDFRESEAALPEQDEVAARLAQPSGADRGSIKGHQAPDPLTCTATP